MPEEVCHCGKPVAYGFDLDPTHHRGMCKDCDAVRCDVDPNACKNFRVGWFEACMFEIGYFLDRFEGQDRQVVRIDSDFVAALLGLMSAQAHLLYGLDALRGKIDSLEEALTVELASSDPAPADDVVV
jgi:hypothetical protein